MTVRKLITLLLNECGNIDGEIDIYVGSSEDFVKDRARNEEPVDDYCEIEGVDDCVDYYHLMVEKLK